MNLSKKVISSVEKVLLGKPEAVRLAVACFLAEGHLLIDDIPGVGKTTLALALAKSVGCSFQRIQFTSDMLPSDLMGVSIFNQQNQSFDFKPGPLFHHVVLADEINRASPKTQSALLESMQERQVSIDRETYNLPRPFFVVATQNPHEHHGTFPLPESQLDRFMMRLNLGYPSEASETAILRGDSIVPHVSLLESVTDAASVVAEVDRVRKVTVDESLDRYMVQVAQATRSSSAIELALSPRGTLALRRCAQALAVTDNRTYVIPDDIKLASVPVISHRLRLRGGNFNGSTSVAAQHVVKEIVDHVPIPI